MARFLRIKPSQKKHIFKFTLFLIIIGGLIAIPLNFPAYQSILNPISVIVIASLLINLAYTYLYTQLYLITIKESEVEFDYGVFSRTTETIEMHRIKDFIKYQDLDDMLFKLATITIHSTDQTTPEIRFRGLHDHDASKVLSLLQKYASDSLVKHLNKQDGIPMNLHQQRAIQKTSIDKVKAKRIIREP